MAVLVSRKKGRSLNATNQETRYFFGAYDKQIIGTKLPTKYIILVQAMAYKGSTRRTQLSCVLLYQHKKKRAFGRKCAFFLCDFKFI